MWASRCGIRSNNTSARRIPAGNLSRHEHFEVSTYRGKVYFSGVPDRVAVHVEIVMQQRLSHCDGAATESPDVGRGSCGLTPIL